MYNSHQTSPNTQPTKSCDSHVTDMWPVLLVLVPRPVHWLPFQQYWQLLLYEVVLFQWSPSWQSHSRRETLGKGLKYALMKWLTWGIWVVFPLPVSPTTTQEWLDLNSFKRTSLAEKIGRAFLSASKLAAIVVHVGTTWVPHPQRNYVFNYWPRL